MIIFASKDWKRKNRCKLETRSVNRYQIRTVNLRSKMVQTKYVSVKMFRAGLLIKPKLYIVLLIHQQKSATESIILLIQKPNSTTNLANLAGCYCKGRDKNIFFQRCVFPLIFQIWAQVTLWGGKCYDVQKFLWDTLEIVCLLKICQLRSVWL